MIQSEEDIVNACLSVIGEAPISGVLTDNPASTTILALLRSKNSLLQAKGFWFNTEYPLIQPDTTGKIIIPNQALKATTVDPYSRLVQRGNYLYDPINTTYTISRPIECKIVYKLEYNELPVVFYEFLKASCVLEFATNMGLESTVLTVHSNILKSNETHLKSEDLINKRITVLDSNVGFALTKKLNPSTITVSRGRAW